MGRFPVGTSQQSCAAGHPVHGFFGLPPTQDDIPTSSMEGEGLFNYYVLVAHHGAREDIQPTNSKLFSLMGGDEYTSAPMQQSAEPTLRQAKLLGHFVESVWCCIRLFAP